MNILESADIVKDLATCIAVQKGITVQEAYPIAIGEWKEIEKNNEVLEYRNSENNRGN